jgi:ubiquinone/menaquinone biosynthesis C-methylase UbiE
MAWRERLVWWLAAPIYDRLARGFDPGRRWAVDALALEDTDRVLLQGCGTGIDLAFLPTVGTVTAVDRSAAMVRRCRRRGAALDQQLSVRVADASSVGCPDHSFDAVLVHFLCSVADDPRGVLAEAGRLLAPAGRISILDEPPTPAAGRPADALDRMVTDAGLAIERRTSFPAGYEAIIAGHR